MRSTRFSLPLFSALLLAVIAWDAAPARADETMPDVVGRPEAAAVRALERRGLNVEVVTIAGHPAGVVASQDPAAGEPVSADDEVEIHVGVRITINTTVPTVVGMTEQEAFDALDETYFLEVEYVRGRREGRVKAQEPAAGSTLPFRGVLRLRVVRNVSEVPALVGRVQGEAVALLEEAGLVPRITYVRRGPGRAGLVLSQLPRAGAEIVPGGAVELTVRGERPAGGRRRSVRVPDLRGLSMRDAEAMLFGLGLTPHNHLVRSPGTPAWRVLSQEVAPGTVVREGTDIGFNVAKPASTPSRIRVPMLYGKKAGEAGELMNHMGLGLTALPTPSGLPPGTVIWQSRSPGSLVAAGHEITVRIAQRPPPGWRPARTRVPQLDNRSPGSAIVALLSTGLNWKLRRDTGPNEDVNRVFRQEPAAGTRVDEGSTVTFYLPLRATMPELAGRTRLGALQRLTNAGLQGLAGLRGLVGTGPTEVVWQQYPAGKVLARGSLVRFRYKHRPLVGALVRVPRVVGLTSAQADAKLKAEGFRVRLRALHSGFGNTVVVSQTPSAGSVLPPGTRVTVSYRYVDGGGPWGTMVRMPRVIGLELDVARARLRALGFRVQSTRSGPHNPFYKTRVVAQSPLATTMLVRGSTVRISYQYVPSGTVAGRTTVPHVVGLRVDRAIERLRNARLNVRVNGVGSHVRSQSRPAGTVVPRGSTVTLHVRF